MHENYLSSAQIRAARALLNWSQDDLAHHSELSVNTIRKLELGHISPRGTTSCSIRNAFEDNGLEFIEPNGVRQRPDDIRVYHDREGYMRFFDDVSETAARKGGEIIAVYESEIPFGYLGLKDYQTAYMEKMIALKGHARVKNILTENKTPLWTSPYIEHRLLSKHYVNSVPFYVYDDKYAIFVFRADPTPKITVIQSRETADAFRLQFQSMWDKATPLNNVEPITTLTQKKAMRG